MHPDHRRIVVVAIACGFLALSGEAFVKIVRRFHMHDHPLAAALCLAAAILLTGWIVFVHTSKDLSPPARVRLDDRRTWRRPTSGVSSQWGALLGAMLAGALVIAAVAVTAG